LPSSDHNCPKCLLSIKRKRTDSVTVDRQDWNVNNSTGFIKIRANSPSHLEDINYKKLLSPMLPDMCAQWSEEGAARAST